jgi:hypothetical protein
MIAIIESLNKDFLWGQLQKRNYLNLISRISFDVMQVICISYPVFLYNRIFSSLLQKFLTFKTISFLKESSTFIRFCNLSLINSLDLKNDPKYY